MTTIAQVEDIRVPDSVPRGPRYEELSTFARAAIERDKQEGLLLSVRSRWGDEPIEISVGVHFGKAVLGDIGANRLEFAVTGNSVNVANRLEAMTRQHETRIVVSDDLVNQLGEEDDVSGDVAAGFEKLPPQEIRGLAGRFPSGN